MPVLTFNDDDNVKLDDFPVVMEEKRVFHDGINSSTGNKLLSFVDGVTSEHFAKSISFEDFERFEDCTGGEPCKRKKCGVCAGVFCRGDTSLKPVLRVGCSGCYRFIELEPSCGQRNCKRCQKKQSRYRTDRYLPALERISTGYGRRWIAVMLSGFRVSSAKLREESDMLESKARAFLKERYLGALVVMEHTYKAEEDEYYVHFHALCLGDIITRKVMAEWERDWGRYIWLSSMHFDPQGHPRTNHEAVHAGIAYLLKYQSKGVALNDKDLKQMKGKRYMSTFGELYNMRLPVWRSRCKACGDKGRLQKISEADIDAIFKEHLGEGWRENEFGEYKEPLEIERVISWPAKRMKDPFVVLKERYDELEQWFKKQIEALPHFDSFRDHVNLLWVLGTP